MLKLCTSQNTWEYSKVWRNALEQDGSADGEPIVLRLEETKNILEILFSIITSSKHPDYIHNQPERLDAYSHHYTIYKRIRVFMELHSLADKYALSSMFKGEVIDQLAMLLRCLPKCNRPGLEIAILALTWALRMRQWAVLLEALNFIQRFRHERDKDRVTWGQYWVFQDFNRWPCQVSEQLGTVGFWMLAQVTTCEVQRDRDPYTDPEYWSYIIDHLPEFLDDSL